MPLEMQRQVNTWRCFLIAGDTCSNERDWHGPSLMLYLPCEMKVAVLDKLG